MAGKPDCIPDDEWDQWEIEARLATAFIPVCIGHWRLSGTQPYPRQVFVALNLQILTTASRRPPICVPKTPDDKNLSGEL